MRKFKINDYVHIKEDCLYGKIVELQNSIAYVEYTTPGGGGCMPFELNELEHAKWCITTDNLSGTGIVYLGWQKPVWNEYGYFWTRKETIKEIIETNNTPEHPFIFDSRKDAIKHLKTIDIPQKCRVVVWC